MDIATPGPNEHARLQMLRLYDILGSEAESEFDDLAEFAANVLETPIGLVSFVDEHRQWFKSHHGLDIEETPRDVAFCAHTILQDKPMVIDDALTDSRFADNPLVVDEPHIRFYAGAPIVVGDGHRLGSLCVVDHVPRCLSEGKIKALEVLRDAVVAKLELRRLRRIERPTEDLLTICAWCERVKADSEPSDTTRWVRASRYLESTHSVTHGICPACRATVSGDG
jgi:GAF domain-containing protein